LTKTREPEHYLSNVLMIFFYA